MNQRIKVWSGLLTVLIALNFSSPTKVLADDFDYPELNVTPLASERLSMESRRESNNAQMWMDHLPIFAPSILTIIAAGKLNSQKDDLPLGDRKDAEDTARVAFGLGAFWIGYSSYLALTYRPFTEGASSVAQMDANSKKSALIRERLAEEKIREAARMGRILSWMSSATLMASSIAVSSKAKNDAQAFGVAAAVSSLAPLIFRYRWEHVEDYHSEYKKRIYGPVVTSGLYGKKFENEIHWAPQILVSYQF